MGRKSEKAHGEGYEGWRGKQKYHYKRWGLCVQGGREAEEKERGGKNETKGGKAGRKRKEERVEGEEGAEILRGKIQLLKLPLRHVKNTPDTFFSYY